MNWLQLLTISVVFYSISTLLQRVLLKEEKNDPISFSIAFQILTGFFVALWAVFRGFSLPNLLILWPNLLLMIVLYAVANVFIFKSLKLLDTSVFTIIFASRTFWTILGAVLLLREAFSLREFLGSLLVFGGVVLVSLNPRGIKLDRGGFYALVAALTFGSAFVNDAFIVRSFDVPSYLTLAFVFPALATGLIYPQSLAGIRNILVLKSLVKLIPLTIIYAISAITIFLAYQVGRNAAQIAPLNQTSIIITVVLSAIFLGERQNLLRNLAAAGLSFAGVLLLV